MVISWILAIGSMPLFAMAKRHSTLALRKKGLENVRGYVVLVQRLRNDRQEGVVCGKANIDPGNIRAVHLKSKELHF